MLPVDDTGATGARTRDGISSICRFQRLTPILRPASTLHHPNCKPENDNGPTATSTQRRQSPRFPAHGPRLESPCPVPLWLLVAGSNSDNAAIELNGTGASLCSTGVAILRRRQSLATHLCPSPLPQQTGPRAPESREYVHRPIHVSPEEHWKYVPLFPLCRRWGPLPGPPPRAPLPHQLRCSLFTRPAHAALSCRPHSPNPNVRVVSFSARSLGHVSMHAHFWGRGHPEEGNGGSMAEQTAALHPTTLLPDARPLRRQPSLLIRRPCSAAILPRYSLELGTWSTSLETEEHNLRRGRGSVPSPRRTAGSSTPPQSRTMSQMHHGLPSTVLIPLWSLDLVLEPDMDIRNAGKWHRAAKQSWATNTSAGRQEPSAILRYPIRH